MATTTETVSTAQTLFSAMRLTNALAEKAASVVSSGNQKTKAANWMSFVLPGIGVASGLSLLAYFKSNPSALQELKDTVEILSSASIDRDPELEKAAEESRSFEKARPENQTVEPKFIPQEVAKPSVEEPKQEEVQAKTVVTPKLEEPPPPKVDATSDKLVPKPGPVVQPKKSIDKRLAVPTEVINKILQNTAKNEGVDYPTLYALAGAESSFIAGAKAEKSTATGLLQFTAGTWDYLTKKVYPDLGYSLADRLDPEKSAIVASRYIKHISLILEKAFSRPPSTGEVYLGYFMGPSGAVSFLKALQSDPNTLGYKAFPKAAKANPTLFFEKGDTSKPYTLLQTFSLLDNKVSGYAKAATAGSVQVASQSSPLPAPVLPSIRTVRSATVVSENIQVPKMQSVASIEADFTAQGKRGNASLYASAQDTRAPVQSSDDRGMFLSNTPPTQQFEYGKDKHGRLIAVRS
jgi:hypothetical protein